MTIEFRLPDLGENVTGGEVVRVLVKEGDAVQENQTVVELETDKALLEVPSPAAGTVGKVHVQPGKKIKINEMILTLEEGAAAKEQKAPEAEKPAAKKEPPIAEKVGSDKPDSPTPADYKPEPKKSAPAPAPPREEAPPQTTKRTPNPDEEPPAAKVVEVGAESDRTVAPAAPSTRRLARELGVDLAQVKGSGAGGRVTPEDIKDYVRSQGSKPAKSSAPETARVEPSPRAIAPLPDFSEWGAVERKPLSGIRRKTMQHLSLSWSTIPHVTQIDEADVTELERLRERHGQTAAARGGKLTSTIFVMKAVVAALKQFPQFNASLDVETEELILKQYYNIGIAVDTEHGLIVPVIRDVDQKHFIDLSAELSMISERTRQRKIKLEELRGATFTISNLGGIGGTAFTPIINYPEVAILGLARYQKRVVMQGDKPAVRTILPLCLSYDHRVIDGADGVRFTRKIATMLEDPALLLLEQ